MYPFELIFRKTIDKPYQAKQVKYLLEAVQYELEIYKPDEIKKGKNWLSFKNRFFRIRMILDIMESTDGGLVEVSETKEHTFGVTYTVSLMRFWIKIIVFFLLFMFTTKLLIISAIFGLFIILFGWLYALLRHRWFSNYLVNKMTKSLER